MSITKKEISTSAYRLMQSYIWKLENKLAEGEFVGELKAITTEHIAKLKAYESELLFADAEKLKDVLFVVNVMSEIGECDFAEQVKKAVK